MDFTFVFFLDGLTGCELRTEDMAEPKQKGEPQTEGRGLFDDY